MMTRDVMDATVGVKVKGELLTVMTLLLCITISCVFCVSTLGMCDSRMQCERAFNDSRHDAR